LFIGAYGADGVRRVPGGPRRAAKRRCDVSFVAVIDNYDSFTYNLVELLRPAAGGLPIEVYRNDTVTAEDLVRREPVCLVISPGPGRPGQAGNSCAIAKRFLGRQPVLGVCLGHQVLGELAGLRLVEAEHCMHGKTCAIHHDGQTLYQGLDNPFEAMRYNSLVLASAKLQAGWEISARSASGEIMGIRQRAWRVEGVQFHPESFATPAGTQLVANFFRCYVNSGIRRRQGGV